MDFKALAWDCNDEHKHVIVRVTFNDADIRTAEDIAKQKIPHVNVHSPGGKNRTEEDILSRIVAGKLADASVAELLRQRIAKFGLQYKLDEYDATRNDSFKDPDLYDLLLVKPGSEETIEVRSSFSYRLAPVNKIVQKISIYGWYTSANKAVEPEKDWYWQVVFYYRPRSAAQSTVAVGVFEDALARRDVVGYVVGGASKSHMQQYGKPRKDDQENAVYQAISPICSAMDYHEMIEAMLGQKVEGT